MTTPAPADIAWTDRTTARWKVRKAIAAALVLAALVIWFLPQDVPRMIAEQDDILLGRYSVERMTLLLVLTPALLIAAKGLGWPSLKRRSGKHVAFALIALSIVLVPALVLLDIAMRKLSPARYVIEELTVTDPQTRETKTEIIFRRPASESVEVTYDDVPPTARSYPNAPPGQPPVTVKLTTDARGFRNAAALESAEIVCVGDSFTEGSRIDDAQTWPVLLGKHTGKSTYNLGMSGGGPRFYELTLEKYGFALSPKVVICMIYAGNDFRVEEAEAGRDNEQGFFARIKNSPIRSRLKSAMVSLLAPINADGAVADSPALSWMPLAMPKDVPGVTPRHYAFEPKRLQQLYVTEQSFGASKDWSAAAAVFARIIEACKAKGTRVIFVYAPSAPAVVMPPVKEQIPAEGLKAFLGYRVKNLPDAQETKKQVFERLDVQENMTAKWCTDRGGEFISLTEPLRQAAMRGEQVYYTYDQHWTAAGQAVAAKVIADYLSQARQD